MKRTKRDQRRSRILTHWDDLARADSGAIDRYRLDAVHDRDAATELCQEFAVRFLCGDFSRADLVADQRRAGLLSRVPDAPDPMAPPGPQAKEIFLGGGQQALLDRGWDEPEEGNPTFCAVRQRGAENPNLPSVEMTGRLAKRLARPMAPGNVCKSLPRPHVKFAELLCDPVGSR